MQPLFGIVSELMMTCTYAQGTRNTILKIIVSQKMCQNDEMNQPSLYLSITVVTSGCGSPVHHVKIVLMTVTQCVLYCIFMFIIFVL